ncbi:MAG: RIP metalloprotease RseP [Alphaproteobacteria bacterium]
MLDRLIGGLGIGNFFLVLTLLIFVHELGHYLVARLCRVKILTFSIGFGPKIFNFFDRRGTEWRFSWLLLGGFVRMLGEMLPVSREKQQDLDKAIKADDLPHAFHKKAVWQRFLIVAAGPIANFLFAFVVFTMMAIGFGIATPKPPSSDSAVVIGQVVQNSAAEFAGIKTADRILMMDKQKINAPSDVLEFMKNATGKKIAISLLRDGEEKLIMVKPNPAGSQDGKTIYRLGIAFTPLGGGVDFQKTNLGGAIKHGANQTMLLTGEIFVAIKNLFSGAVKLDQLGGPVMIAKMSGDVGAAGAYTLFSFMALLSINLAIINLFPIPVLDGGHLVLLAIEQVFRKPLPQAFQQVITVMGAMFLVALMIAVTVKDIWQLWLQ